MAVAAVSSIQTPLPGVAGAVPPSVLGYTQQQQQQLLAQHSLHTASSSATATTATEAGQHQHQSATATVFASPSAAGSSSLLSLDCLSANAPEAPCTAVHEQMASVSTAVEADAASSNDEYTGVFEGAEKTLRVNFVRVEDVVDGYAGVGSIVSAAAAVSRSAHAQRGTVELATGVNGSVSLPDSLPAVSASEGMRALTRKQLDTLLALAECSILSRESNDALDSYVLSESSAFIHPLSVALKTCGQTTLLRALPAVITAAAGVGLVPSFVSYSHKGFLYPEAQAVPHRSFSTELKCLRDVLSSGDAYVLAEDEVNAETVAASVDNSGSNDHTPFYLFAADVTPELKPSVELSGRDSYRANSNVVLEVMMSGLDREVMEAFVVGEGNATNCAEAAAAAAAASSPNSSNNSNGNDSTNDNDDTGSNSSGAESVGVYGLLAESAAVDDHQFSPCGYSLNSIVDSHFDTIHITPEEACSYVSFETTRPDADYGLVARVVEVFKPSSFIVVMHVWDDDRTTSGSGSGPSGKHEAPDSIGACVRGWSQIEPVSPGYSVSATGYTCSP